MLVEYPDMPAFASNNRGNACPIYLELEQSRFEADKPRSTSVSGIRRG